MTTANPDTALSAEQIAGLSDPDTLASAQAQLADALVFQLGGAWRAHRDRSLHHLLGPHGERVLLTLSAAGNISMSAFDPDPREPMYLDRTLEATTPPVRIADVLVTEILPEYRAALDRWNAHRHRRQQQALALSHWLPGSWHVDFDHGPGTVALHCTSHAHQAQIVLHADDTITARLDRLQPRLAARIATTLADYTETEALP